MLWLTMELICVRRLPHQWDIKTPLGYNEGDLLPFCHYFQHATIMKKINVTSLHVALQIDISDFGKIMKDMKHIRNLNNMAYMEVKEDYSHTNYSLAPVIPHEHRDGVVQRFIGGEDLAKSGYKLHMKHKFIIFHLYFWLLARMQCSNLMLLPFVP